MVLVRKEIEGKKGREGRKEGGRKREREGDKEEIFLIICFRSVAMFIVEEVMESSRKLQSKVVGKMCLL